MTTPLNNTTRAAALTAASATTFALAAFLSACAVTPNPAVPAALDPGSDQSSLITISAKGVQIYECRAQTDKPAGHQWVFVAPEAELFDARGLSIGSHGAGPFWQERDGSRIVGSVKARADAPDRDAIAWLLLSSKAVGAQGAFSKVTSIQRINTAGGLAPATGCNAASVGAAARVPYTADYRFFSAR